MKTLAPPSLTSIRPGLRMIWPPRMSCSQVAIASGSGLRRWMWSQVTVGIWSSFPFSSAGIDGPARHCRPLPAPGATISGRANWFEVPVLCRPGGMAMIADLFRFEAPRLSYLGRKLAGRHLGAPPGWLLAVLVAGLGFAIMLFGRAHDAAESGAAHAVAIGGAEPATFPAASSAHNAAQSGPADALAMATPTDGLKISSQSWRRGGFGSRALVTLTLRNDNDYAVGDIALVCAFSRPDGSVVTERRPTIHDAIKPKSRKTFVGVHAGFVNI